MKLQEVANMVEVSVLPMRFATWLNRPNRPFEINEMINSLIQSSATPLKLWCKLTIGLEAEQIAGKLKRNQ